MKSRVSLFAVLIVLVLAVAQGQYRPPSSSNTNKSKMSKSGSSPFDKFYFGGGGGFSGGTNYINLSLSPLVGYKITEAFSGGVQITYQYVKSGNYKISNYGGGPFLRYNVSEKLFAYTQYEYLNFGYYDLRGEIQRLGFDSWFVGLGYTEPIGKNLSFNIMALYNLLYSDGTNTPYQSPLVFRVGLVGGLR
jgi:hypothetical protein